MKELLSVSEIAKEAGVSRNLVWAYIRKNKIKPVENGKKFKFDSRIVSEIKEKQAKKHDKSTVSKAISENVLEILEKQLATKDKQIERLEESLKFAQLSAIDSKKAQDEQAKRIEHSDSNLDSLKQENDALEKENEDLKKELEELKNRGFWDRMLNKN